MEDMLYLKKVCAELNWGTLLEVPEKIGEGTYYKSYRIKNEKGVFEIKILLPELLKKENIKTTLKISELIAQKLEDYDFSVTTPIVVNEKRLQEVDGRTFYVYHPAEGNKLDTKDVIIEHCKTIGTIIGNIHNLDFKKVEKVTQPYLHIRWRKYLRLAEHKGSPITQTLSENIKLLEQTTELCNNSVNKLDSIEAITHNHFKCDSLIWRKDSSCTITNTELMRYGNPYIEALTVALYWAGIEEYKVNYNLFNTIIKEYFKIVSKPSTSWTYIYDVAYKEYLRIIEDDIKKSLLIDCTDKHEQLIAEERIITNIKRLVYYVNIKDEILKRLD